ncbi:hypothetical protein BCM14_1619 [Jezberella montanilacus]|uniref:Uncharacterized protein n=1 Tax=Jezberella montanilacus TaxID=323426 RepID=A0A2T0XG66_9BURK|nr:hypothetical protein [Jezberella montanilacus]PRY97907.1 hypothetical protein BCM14_1619 [Jezberella montanilacus]
MQNKLILKLLITVLSFHFIDAHGYKSKMVEIPDEFVRQRGNIVFFNWAKFLIYPGNINFESKTKGPDGRIIFSLTEPAKHTWGLADPPLGNVKPWTSAEAIKRGANIKATIDCKTRSVGKIDLDFPELSVSDIVILNSHGNLPGEINFNELKQLSDRLISRVCNK